MARPKLTLELKLARRLGFSEEFVYGVIRDPRPFHESDCWVWPGHCNERGVPVINIDGGPQPLRRVIRATRLGVPIPPNVRVMQGCPTWKCIHPDHVVEQTRRISASPVPEDERGGEATVSIADMATWIYDEPQPWDAAQLAEAFDQPLRLVTEALRQIHEGKM